jgi:hypothetical protein
MSKNIYDSLIELSEKIDYNLINVELIKSNAKILTNEYFKIKHIYDNLKLIESNNFVYKKITKTTETTIEFNKIIEIITNSFFAENSCILNFLSSIVNIGHFQWNNIDFYWLNNNSDEDLNYNKSLNMFIIAICLNLYKFDGNDTIKRIIYWIPINKSRNFEYNVINEQTLNETMNNFEAFVASGVTWGLNPKYTIITRYEEIEKLLIHELIHNYNIDGSAFHEHNHDVIQNYKKLKKSGNYNYEYSIYESYTELLSSYFNLIFVNIKLVQTSKEIKKKIFCQIIIELLYSYNLIANLIKLNNYSNYKKFAINKIFKGDICFYEYYYVKAILYNNFEILFGFTSKDFKKIYKQINLIIAKMDKYNDDLLECVYNNNFSQTNFEYIIVK